MLCFLFLKCLSDLPKLILEQELAENGWLQKSRRDAGHLTPMLLHLIFEHLYTSIKDQRVGMIGKKKVHWGKSRNRDPGHLCSRTVFPFLYTFLYHGVLHTSSTMLLKFRGTTELVSANNTI